MLSGNIALRVFVNAPYDLELKAKLLACGGRWIPKTDIWTVPAAEESRVRDAFFECFGADGVRLSQVDLTLHFAPGAIVETDQFYLRVLHWTIANRAGYKAQIADDDVEIVAGTLELERLGVRNYRLRFRAPEFECGSIVLKNVSTRRAQAIVSALRADGFIEDVPSIVNATIKPSLGGAA